MRMVKRLRRSLGLAVVVTTGMLIFGASSALAGLQSFYTASGSVDLTQTGFASNSGPQTKPLIKPSASATVRQAFLFAAGTPGYTPQNGDITLDGTPVTFSDTPVTASFGAITRETDVTSIVAPVLNAAAAGPVNFTVDEVNNTFTIDGEALVVIFNDPTTTNNTVALMYGTEDTTGDTFNVGFAQPIDLSKESIEFAIGDSYSYQGVAGSPVDQYSVIDVNGTPPDPSNPAAGPDPARLTTSAGGQDDEVPGCDANGCLMTVGGVGDNPANPTQPFATPTTCGANPPYTCDDELYTLGAPFVQNGQTSMSVYTINPSNNDDIFYASFFFQGLAAVVGEGVTLAPPTQTDPVDGSATVTAHVQDTNGNPISGRSVTFTINSGPNAGETGSVNTDPSGNASFSYSSSSPGTDNVTASFTDDSGNTQTSNNVTVVWSSADTTPPSCKVTGHGAGPPQTESVTVQDTGSGLARIYRVKVRNGSVAVPSFTPGTTSPVVVTTTKKNQSHKTVWSFYAEDEAGNIAYCH